MWCGSSSMLIRFIQSPLNRTGGENAQIGVKIRNNSDRSNESTGREGAIGKGQSWAVSEV